MFVEDRRREVYALRREILLSTIWSIRSMLTEDQHHEMIRTVGEDELEKSGRRLALAIIDELWSDYLANVAELKGGIHWIEFGGRDPLYEFLLGERGGYADFHPLFRTSSPAGR